MLKTGTTAQVPGDILFVLGAPRSGTSLLSRLLLEYFDIGIGPEGQWIAPLAHRAPEFGDLEEEANLRRLIDAVLSTEMFRIVEEQYSARFGWTVSVTPAGVREHLVSKSYAGVADASLRCLAEQLRRGRVGSKDPGFYKELATLETLFPLRAKYLAIVRDGRDVALSMMRQPWGQKTWYANARLWVDTYARIDAFRPTIAPERFLQISYETLLARPEEVCRSLEAFLEFPLDVEKRQRFVEELIKGPLSQNSEKWKGAMSPRDHRLYEAVAGSWLERFGYQRLSPGARAHAFERVWYSGLEFARRLGRKGLLVLGIGATDTPTRTRFTSAESTARRSGPGRE